MPDGPDDHDVTRDSKGDAPESDPSVVDNTRFRCVQFPTGMERNLPHRGPGPEESVIRNEPTVENLHRNRREQADGDMEERARGYLEEELQALSYIQKGVLGVYRVDVCKERPEDVARALYLPKKESLYVTIWRALSACPCGPKRGRCDRVPGCAHEQGKRLWDEIRRRVASKLDSK